VMLHVFLEDFQLCAPRLVVLRQFFQLGQKLLDDMVLLVSLKRNVFRLVYLLENRIKDCLFYS
jgi:hypothetical protein